MSATCRAAELAAKKLTRKSGRYWRDVLGAAWEGAARAAAKYAIPDTIPPGDPRGGLLYRAAVGGVVDRMRIEMGGSRAKHKRPAGLPLKYADQTPDTREQPGRDEAARKLEAWGEYRRERAGCPMRARVFLYLWLVEGWTQTEVAAAFQITPRGGSQMLAAARREIDAARKVGAA